MSYITNSVDEFFVKLNKMQSDLAKFSQNLDNRSAQIPELLKNFEKAVFDPSNAAKTSSNSNKVEKAVEESLSKLRVVVGTWSKKIEADRKGKEFIRKNEKYLVVMVFGAVKAGKSTLGNFFAGKKFVNAPFDNPYKHITKPKFEIEEGGRDTGGIEKDSSGDEWFAEGYIDTTGAIQYFTLSGLRWIDSPGTGAVAKIGDKLDMTKLVKEYISYTDMCIFLMNSSEPGLQDDMAYMQDLNKEGQEALVVITKSDFHDEDVDDDGNLISILSPKSNADRKLQEDDICKRIKKQYPDIDENKFRAISISTALAGEAIADEDDNKFKDSRLDLLMKILGDKVSDNAIERKQANPQRLLNHFVDSVVESLSSFNTDLNTMTAAIDKYKSEMDKIAALIVTNVKREVRAAVEQQAYSWNVQVKRGQSIGSESVNASVATILQQKLNEEINAQMRRIVEDFESQEMPTVKANLDTAALSKKTAQISHTYTNTYLVERPPDGIIEKVRGFFGKKFYKTSSKTETEYQTVDIGTNIDEFLNSLMPQVEKYAQNQANESLVKLRDTYFAGRELFVKNMKAEIDKLRNKLIALKF